MIGKRIASIGELRRERRAVLSAKRTTGGLMPILWPAASTSIRSMDGESESAYMSAASLVTAHAVGLFYMRSVQCRYIGSHRLINDQHEQVTVRCLRKSQQQQFD